ncbi:MAG: DUF1232 domain-containing protein [Anaerolineae bacterium]|nr:DUF1232 domain-containing protein [Anaerolineae bacterium]
MIQETAPPENKALVSRALNWLRGTYRGSVLLVILMSAAYVVLPVDLIPDVFLGAGQVDDAAAATAGGSTVFFLTMLRVGLQLLLQSRLARAGCAAVVVVLGTLLVALGVISFFLIYRMVESL